MNVTEGMVIVAAMAEADCDNRGWLHMPKTSRGRYIDRARFVLDAVARANRN